MAKVLRDANRVAEAIKLGRTLPTVRDRTIVLALPIELPKSCCGRGTRARLSEMPVSEACSRVPNSRSVPVTM